MENEKPWAKLCSDLQLGEPTGVPEAVSGGLLHRLVALDTTRGKYAVKRLNPGIMARPEAKGNFVRSERVACLAFHAVPALPALLKKGTALQEIGGHFYLVYQWVDGRALKPDQLTEAHAEKMGTILARLHETDFTELDLPPEAPPGVLSFPWETYLKKGIEAKAEWAKPLLTVIGCLYDWQDQANGAANRLDGERVISHRDLDPKNVLWQGNQPTVIDWESAGWIHPLCDLAETAVYWSQDGARYTNDARFRAFLKGYGAIKTGGEADWRTVLEDGFAGPLAWLDYNLKRSLRMEGSDEEEQQLGTRQAVQTLDTLQRYANSLPRLESLLHGGVDRNG
ncbi:phosphotransferase [Paenibacillus aurantius]|uniref:Phosphotransferase n=1 Tax=Paenibacillus aurantius TaxID=2918900 RepID=A0AA96LG24_9BACL|nr:phosphotransferase [Paenibacillus aurantius]WNQ11311.1 phosphotransferase [Paenibacillus aurantius]